MERANFWVQGAVVLFFPVSYLNRYWNQITPGFGLSWIVLPGTSAGGNLTLITGFLPEGPVFDRQCPTDDKVRWRSAEEPPARVAAVVNWDGITDVAELLEESHAKHYVIEWFGSMPTRMDLAPQLSPISSSCNYAPWRRRRHCALFPGGPFASSP